jgi:esterase
MAPELHVDLHVRRAGEGEAVLLLHGLFGAGANMGALARALQDRFAVYSVDLPNHGRSGWLRHPDLPAMAQCLRAWMDAQDLAQVHLVGHSLGGKVAMQLALGFPGRVRSLVVADMAPVTYDAHHESVFTALEAVAAQHLTRREEAADLLAYYLHEDAVVQFLLSSLQRDAGGILHWRFDLQGIRAAYPALLAAPQSAQVYAGPVLFIKGSVSDYIKERHWPAIQAFFPAAALTVMPDCGHWLHVQQPQQFNGIVTDFLGSVVSRKLAVTGTGSEGKGRCI